MLEPKSYVYKNSFNQTVPVASGSALGWISPDHFGINMGPMAIMIENYLSGLTWSLTRRSPYAVAGLRKAGFAGGWLAG